LTVAIGVGDPARIAGADSRTGAPLPIIGAVISSLRTSGRGVVAVALAAAVFAAPAAAAPAHAAGKKPARALAAKKRAAKKAKRPVETVPVTAAPAPAPAAAPVADVPAAPAAPTVNSVISIGGYVFYNLTYAEAVAAYEATVAALPVGTVPPPPVTSVSVTTTVGGSAG
jgi:hypothetical protein